MALTHPKLYESWLSHDVNRRKMWLFKGVPDHDLVVYWEIMERKYLNRYKMFIRMDFEFSASGLSWIDYPGQRHSSPDLLYDNFPGLPESSIAELQEWLSFVGRLTLQHGTPADWHRSEEWGLSVAKGMGPYVPEDIYFEFRYLRRIVVRDGKGVELDYDPEIQRILNLY